MFGNPRTLSGVVSERERLVTTDLEAVLTFKYCKMDFVHEPSHHERCIVAVMIW
jgi:hypothetical protein